MTAEQKRIAIAEACGVCTHQCHQPHEGGANYIDEVVCADCNEWLQDWPQNPHLPDYCNDLNAMHEAEMTLSYEQLKFYKDALKTAVGCGVRFVCAAAEQRADAFLLTINT